MFVRNNRPSAPKPEVGRVLELNGEDARVEFWDSTNVSVPQRFLEPLPSDAPEALLWEQPGELASWAEEAPLKLAAAALSVGGNIGKSADIRAKLDGRVPLGGAWDSWWKKRAKSLGSLPEHFRVVKANKGNQYELLATIDVVPPDWTPPPEPEAVTAADWKKWLNARTHEPPPGRFPPKPVSGALAKWPAKTIEDALFRVMITAEEITASGDISPQVAEGWLRAVAQASLRWREVAGPDSRGRQAARIGALLVSLSRVAGGRTPQELLLQAGGLDGAAAAWQRGFAAGMWESFSGEDSRQIYLQSSRVLGRQAREDLARELFLSAFGPTFLERRHGELDRLLDELPGDQRTKLLLEAMASANTDQRAAVLGYIANSRYATKSQDPAQRLNLLALAAILLSDGQGEVADRASRELADAFAAPKEYGPAAQAVFRDTRACIAEERARVAGDLESQRQSHAARLERERREQERLRQQVRDLDAEVRAKREASKLEIRRDMLLAVGEVLQWVARYEGSVDKLAEGVEAGLRIALRAGEADLLDTAPEGKVLAPGVVVRDETHGDLVLLKALVKNEAI